VLHERNTSLIFDLARRNRFAREETEPTAFGAAFEALAAERGLFRTPLKLSGRAAKS
jgi:hypothetical protein